MRDERGQFVEGQRIVNQYGWALYFTDTHKKCSKCDEIKPHNFFHKDSSNKYGLSYWCKDCAKKSSKKHHSRKQKSDPDYVAARRNYHISSKYGITSSEYDAKLKAQNSRCSICNINLFVKTHQCHLDHDHKTGKLRDFLCTNCNRGLGHFKDSPELLVNAANYLKKHIFDVAGEKEGRLYEGAN